MKKKAPVTMSILTVIAAVFAFEVFTNAFDSNELLERMGAIVPHLVESGAFWRLVASMFLHGSWLHWLANSWAIYQLGTLYEVLFGSKRFAMVYFVSGIAAGIASSLHLEQGVAVGASGAVFGILGAFIFSLLRSPQYRHQPWTKSLIGQLVFWIAVNLYIGYTLPFIDNVAHVGGLIAGLALGFLPHRVPPPPPGSSVIEVRPYDDGGAHEPPRPY